MRKLYRLQLSDDERQELKRIVRTGKVAAWKRQRAQALLKIDSSDGAPAWTDQRISDAFGISIRSLESWRRQGVERGPMSLLERKKRAHPATPAKLDGAAQAKLMKICCSTPPAGHARWSLRLLAERLVELEIVESISHETVSQVLKKNRAQAVAPSAVVHPAGAGRRLRR
jgi:hypothetical protein